MSQVVRPPGPPETIEALMVRARRLAGFRVGDLARRYGYRLPSSLRANKGFIGQLIEVALGADGGSTPGPDFAALGVELKTLPVRADGRVTESTFVCLARLDGHESLTYEDSYVAEKLDKVLFMPIGQDDDLAERTLGMAFLWQPTSEERATLDADFRLIQGRVRLGEGEEIRASEGVALHLRPKGLTREDRTMGLSDEGWLVPVRPRGWYLRASFTSGLLAKRFGLM